MNQILKGDIDNATKGLFRETNILSQNEMAPMQLSTDLMTLQADYGTPIGFQLISEHTLRQALVRFQYLLKFKTQPVVWEFYYYQPESTWLLYMINFDRELGELFPK